jgi:replicative DNA helicase
VLIKQPHLIAEANILPEHFSVPTNAAIFSAALQVTNSGGFADIITVAEYLEKEHRAVDMDYFRNVVERGVGSPKNLQSYCKILKTTARKQKAKDAAHLLLTSIEENIGADPIQQAIKDLMEIDSAETKYEHDFRDAARSALEFVDAAHKRDGLLGITTGLEELDKAIGGYNNTDLVVIPARPAMGKTAFLLSCLHKCGVPAGLISAEQDHMQVGLRLISMQGSVNSQNLRTATLDASEWSKVTAGSLALQNMEGAINDKPGINILEVVAQARKWKFDRDIKILYVDYIQKIKGSNSKATRVEQVTEVVGTLKNLAKELQIPVVALAQVNRQCEQRPDKRPMASDIADASEIEKEADVIMTLYRDEVYNEDTNDKSVAELNLVKNRHGPTGTLRCQFIGKYFQFKDFQSVSNYMEKSA